MNFSRLEFDAYYAEKYADWVDRVTKMHHDFRPFQNETVAWTPTTRPLSESRVAVVTTTGVHLKSDTPFDQFAKEGDPTCRVIPGNATADSLMISHNHFNHEDGDRDINCVFPIDRLRELAADGVIGEVSPVHYGFMGFNPNPYSLLMAAAEAADGLVAAGVDLVLFTPG